MRLFVALELPPAPRSALAGWGARAVAGDPALRAVAAPALHVTLHFLGERPDDEAGRPARGRGRRPGRAGAAGGLRERCGWRRGARMS